jgi:sulfur carrier protein
MPAQGSQRDARLADAVARFFYLKELEVKLTVNGEAYESKRADSVAALLEEMGIGGRPVVVVLNDEVIPASSRSACGLREGDCVELFRLVGGG